MARIGRPPTCDCGECRKCKRRVSSKEWWDRKTPEERSAIVARRDKEKTRAADRARYYRHKAKRRALNDEWARKNPERAREIGNHWAERNPEKRKAQWSIANALRDGHLEKGPCEVGTGCEGKIEGHHDDYSKPLEVRWLCRKHHAQHHAALRGHQEPLAEAA